jgi:hypothetical protein
MKHTLTKMDFMSCDCFIIRRYTDYLTIRFCSMIYLDEHLRDVIENSSASAQLLIFLQFRRFFVRRGGFPRALEGRFSSLVVRRLFALRCDEDS